MLQHRLNGISGKSPQAQKSGIVSVFHGKIRLVKRLFRPSANAGDFQDPASANRAPFVNEARSLFQDRFKQPDFLFTYLKLRGVNADGNPSGSGVNVIAAERTLMFRGKGAVLIQRQRLRRNHGSAPDRIQNRTVDICNRLHLRTSRC